MSNEIYAEADYCRNFLEKLWQQCGSEDLCDVVLIAGKIEKRIPAHRLILSVSSEYFRGMFSSSMLESRKREIELPSIDGDALRSLVEYSYTGRVVISEDTVVDMLKTADLLLLQNVVTACENFLVERLHPSNCLGFTFLAEQHHCETLSQKAKDYSLIHFMDVCKTDEFFRLNAGQLSQLLACDDLYVPAEEEVFKCVIQWIERDQAEREEYKEELLKVVRLPLLKRPFLVQHVKPVCTTAECMRIYMEALEWIGVTAQRKVATRTDEFLLAITKDEELQELYIHYYCTRQNKWMKWLKHLEYRQGFHAAVMADNVFIIGGYGAFKNLNTVLCLNLKTMTTGYISPMRKRRVGCRAIALKEFLYVVGGVYESSCEKWNPKTNSWSNIASMSIDRYDFGIAILNNKIYVVGGCTKYGKEPRSVEYYDPDYNVWTRIACMNHHRFYPGIGVQNGRLYAVGDLGEKTVESYDPKTNKWTMKCSLSENLNAIQPSTTFRNKVVVCYKNRLEEYDSRTNTWKVNPTSNAVDSRVFTYSGPLLISHFLEN